MVPNGMFSSERNENILLIFEQSSVFPFHPCSTQKGLKFTSKVYLKVETSEKVN